MSWQCGFCHREDELPAVCHHCGTLLCVEHQYELWDHSLRDASRRLRQAGRWASHCADCRRSFHPRSVPRVRLLRRP